MKSWLLPISNFLAAFVVCAVVMYIDTFAFRNIQYLQLIIDYFSSFGYAYYILYQSPHIQFLVTQLQTIERKSHKEMSFLNKLNFMFIFNSMVCPFVVALMLENTTGKYLNEE